MSDSTSGAGSSGQQSTSGHVDAARAGEGGETAPSFAIAAQYIKDFSFENPNAPQSLMPGQPAPQISVDIDVHARQLSEQQYEVDLVVRAKAVQTENDRTVFLSELTYSAVLSLQNVDERALPYALYVEGPRMLFPFARQILADATKDGGFPPLMINPVNFLELLRYKRERASGQNAGDGDSGGAAAQTTPSSTASATPSARGSNPSGQS